MDLGQAPLAGGTVQVVDVLADDVLQQTAALHLRQRRVRRIWASALDLVRLARGLAVEFLPPVPRRVGEKALEAVHRRLALLGVDPAAPAIRPDAALDADPGAD